MNSYQHSPKPNVALYYRRGIPKSLEILEHVAQQYFQICLYDASDFVEPEEYAEEPINKRIKFLDLLTELQRRTYDTVAIPSQLHLGQSELEVELAVLDMLHANANRVVFIEEQTSFGRENIKELQAKYMEHTTNRSAKRGHAVWLHSPPGDLAEGEQAPPQSPPRDGSIEDRPASETQAKSVEGSAKSKHDAKLPHAPDAPAAGDAQQVWPHSANKAYSLHKHNQNGATAKPPSIKSVATSTCQRSHTKTKSVATPASGPAPNTEAKKKRIVIRASLSESQKKHFERELPPGIRKSYALRHFALERGSWETLEAESFSKSVTRQHSYLMNNIGQIACHKIPGIDADLDELIKVVNQLPQKKLQPGQRAAKLLDRTKAIGRQLNKVAHYVNATHPEGDRIDRQRIVDELREITAQVKSLLEGGV